MQEEVQGKAAFLSKGIRADQALGVMGSALAFQAFTKCLKPTRLALYKQVENCLAGTSFKDLAPLFGFFPSIFRDRKVRRERVKVTEFCISEKTQLGRKGANCSCRGITRAAATICPSAHLEQPPAVCHGQA